MRRKRSTNTSATSSRVRGNRNQSKKSNDECANFQTEKYTDADIGQVCSTFDVGNQSDSNVVGLQSPNFSMDMIPDFDPSNEKITIEMWLLKVNECAEKYGWDDDHTLRYAFSKLHGSAKVWVQSQTFVLHSWARWQDLLSKAFPSITDYAEILTVMLDRRLKMGEDLEEYYHDKMALLTPCEIDGERAVDCIIHGIDDFSVRAAATALQCSKPEELLYLLKDIFHEQEDTGNGWCI